MPRTFRRSMLTLLAATASAVPLLAQAATPFLLPLQFSTQNDHMTVQAAQASEAYFVGAFPLRGGKYTLISPDGAGAEPGKVVDLTDVTMIEAALPTPGTYRLTTGPWVARTTRLAKIDGAWKTIRPTPPPGRPVPPPNPRFIEEAALPAGAETLTTQGILISEVYITRGGPTDTAMKPSGKGLEVTPSHNPTDIFGGDTPSFLLTLDGKPLAGAPVVMHVGGNTYDDKAIFAEGVTGADGTFKHTLPPGVYSLQMAYPPPAPPNPAAAPTLISYVYTMTFEVNK